MPRERTSQEVLAELIAEFESEREALALAFEGAAKHVRLGWQPKPITMAFWNYRVEAEALAKATEAYRVLRRLSRLADLAESIDRLRGGKDV